MLIRHLFNLKKIKKHKRGSTNRWNRGERRREEREFMYRYLHGCKVTKSCGMLQVADPRPAPEECLLPATPLHSRPEWFLNLKGGKKTRSGQWLHHWAMSEKTGRWCFHCVSMTGEFTLNVSKRFDWKFLFWSSRMVWFEFGKPGV